MAPDNGRFPKPLRGRGGVLFGFGGNMKWMTALALVAGANFGLLLWGQAPLIWSGTTADQWSRSCKYYYPMSTFDRLLPLSQSCPRWVKPE